LDKTMAKGDSKKAQSQIDTQGRIAQEGMNSLNQTLYPQQNQMFNNYLYGSGINLNDYDSIMNSFRNFYSNPYGGGGGNQFGGGGMAQPDANTGGGPVDYQSVVKNLIGDRPITLELMESLQPELQKYGMDLEYNARRNAADIKLPSGQIVDFVSAFEGPVEGRKFQWDVGMPGGGQQSIFGGGPYGPALSQALAGYSNFAETGGFSPQDMQDMRARATGPIRSIYSSGRRELERGQRLGGGSANKSAAEARMARQQAYATGDISQNVEASLAQMRQGGRLAGLGGLSQLGLSGQGQDISARLGALSGMAGLYGTTPGLINTFGNQVLGGQQNLLGGQGLQNQLGLGLIGSQINKSQIPGDWQQAMGNIGSAINMGSRIISPFGIFGGGGQSAPQNPVYSPNLGAGVRF
jgi:hypothetical protein